MNHVVMEILNGSAYISAILIILSGCLLVISFLLWPVWILMNQIYKRVEGSIYFVSYVLNRKKFKEWHKETNPDVHEGHITNKDF